jgi:hypothetical protein
MGKKGKPHPNSRPEWSSIMEGLPFRQLSGIMEGWFGAGYYYYITVILYYYSEL